MSLASGTSNQYRPYIRKWVEFCNVRKIDPVKAPTNSGIEFLTKLFHESNISYSAINTARSALSLVIDPIAGYTFGSQPLVRRFMAGIFKLIPSLPKYVFTYDVRLVLEHMSKVHTSLLTPLKDLTYKLVMLLCLLTGQRNQSLAALDTKFMQLTEKHCIFYIPTILKTTRPGHHLEPIELTVYVHDVELCPIALIRTYLAATENVRGEQSRLLLSIKAPHNPVSSKTLARWCKETLSLAGINCNIFSAHSTRSTATSYAYGKGLSLNDIRKAAAWSNAHTFAKFYNKPLPRNFGATILS